MQLKSNKGGEIPMVKTITIILTASIILISFLIILIPAKSFSIDEKKINTQLAIKKIINSNCFSDEYASIEESNFKQENLDTCLSGNEELLLKTYILGGEKLFLNGKENEFNQKKKTCSFSSKSNTLCSDVRYPIIYIDSKQNRHNRILVIQTLVQ
ncbi:MAG: hypothetical protein KC589_02315 [Nanoarchaeota archaeon]|nr:hypothetical protein [Nanoarchaeota archaeon]